MRQTGFAMLALLLFMTLSSGVLLGIMPDLLFIANKRADREDVSKAKQSQRVAHNSVRARNRSRLRIRRALYLWQLFNDSPSLSLGQKASIKAAITKLVLSRRRLCFASGDAVQAAQDIVKGAREKLESLLIRAGVASKEEAAERARYVQENLGSTDDH